MEQEKLQKLIELMNQNSLIELEIESEGERIRLKKSGEAKTLVSTGISARAVEQQVSQQKEEPPQNLIPIKAPMVGTFYRAPALDAAPFVDINADISVGQVVCVIEAMKVMNEIKSETKGKIKQILVENVQPVEFGQTLFLVETP
ncbi:acetyl-CoA carboxylase, biotin carboxyl carrier protein [bacterium Unc6]|nr:acetyl-CoA carboxylase, biotin carboxyl carrier protein [bacterium Unc6]